MISGRSRPQCCNEVLDLCLVIFCSLYPWVVHCLMRRGSGSVILDFRRVGRPLFALCWVTIEWVRGGVHCALLFEEAVSLDVEIYMREQEIEVMKCSYSD